MPKKKKSSKNESDDDDKRAGDEYGYNSDDEMNDVFLSESDSSRLQTLGQKKSKNSIRFISVY